MHWIFLIGFVTGLRTLTGMAVVCWCARLGFIPVENTWAAWAGSWAAVVIFTLLALGEYVGDVLPRTPSRRAPGPAIARLVFGGVVGAICSASQMEPAAGGVILGMLGALLGTHLGYWLRMKAARAAGRDLPVGLAESALALTLAIADGYWLHMSALRSALIEAGKMKGAG